MDRGVREEGEKRAEGKGLAGKRGTWPWVRNVEKHRTASEALARIRLLDKVNKNVPTRTFGCTCDAITDARPPACLPTNIFHCIPLSVI